MATVADVLNLALKDAGIIGEGDAASAETFSDAYQTLLQMLAIWQTDSAHVYALADTSFAASGATSYTVGSTGNFAVLRPEKIDSVYWSYNGYDIPVPQIYSFEEYDNIPNKVVAGDPRCVFYSPTYTNGTLYVYPQPSTGTLHILTLAAFPALATTAATLTLPPQYVLPIRLSLAELMCILFNLPLSQALVMAAAKQRKLLKRINVRVPELSLPTGLISRRPSNIFIG